MAPKFRGGSDDWLDDERTPRAAKAGRGKKGGPQKPVPLRADLANAVVTEVFPKQCRVKPDVPPEGKNVEEVQCSYRRVGVIGAFGGEYRERSPVSVGDRVQIEEIAGGSVVTGVCARENFLSRLAPGREGLIRHVVAANVDCLSIVASVAQPDFSPGLVDRYLVAAASAGIEPLICVTKIDLAELAPAQNWRIYAELGYNVLEVSGKRGDHVDELLRRIHGKRVAFCGHSGVGKTSLLRALTETGHGKIGDVSQYTGKGRHTTTNAVMLPGTAWIDTPGVREFALTGTLPEELSGYFPELKDLDCSKRGCMHWKEEHCDARGLERHPSYQRILESLLADESH